MTSHFLFISVDYIAKYTGDGVFFEEKHFFGGFCQRKNLCEASCVMRGDIFDRFQYRLYMNVISDAFRFEVFPEFLLEKSGRSSAREKDVF